VKTLWAGEETTQRATDALRELVYCRVRRFQRALGVAAAKGNASWADLALAAGYSDQSHFNREFLEFAGIPPGRYRAIAPLWSNHVPIRPT
jgi:AraC-like DNA-binding protein